MKNLALLVLSLIFSLAVSAQQPTLQDKLRSEVDLNTQFQLLLNQSRNQDGTFKIIRRTNVEIIQKNVNDSLTSYRQQITDLKALTNTAETTISNLQDSLSSLKLALADEQQKTATIGFFGMDVKKEAYHMMVWSIIAVLAIFLFVFLLSYRKAKVDAVEHKSAAEDVQNELQAFKKKAMEKEQQLKRQLLDEQLKRNS